MKATNPVLYPQVTRLPSQTGVGEQGKNSGESAIKKGEFDQSLDQALQNQSLGGGLNSAKQANLSAALGSSQLGQPSAGIKFSAHATQRLKERNIQFDPDTMSRMNDAINKADAKGVQDTLMLTDKAALIVNVPNRTVITAMDRNNLSGNVFTNIDGAVII